MSRRLFEEFRQRLDGQGIDPESRAYQIVFEKYEEDLDRQMFRAFGDPDQEQQDEEPDAEDDEVEAPEEAAPKPEKPDDADAPQ